MHLFSDNGDAGTLWVRVTFDKQHDTAGNQIRGPRETWIEPKLLS